MLSFAQGIPDMERLSPNLLVPFEAARIESARILWLNEGWFLQRDIDVLDRGVRGNICNDLLESFGVGACAAGARQDRRRGRLMQADRYGGSGGAHHGGSGRCGIVGHLNGKGIGRTPLAPDNIDWNHSHGFLWLGEAIRETVAAEVAAAELPHGAVPVIAIIDLGVGARENASSPMNRRAVLVRPNFLRPAHFERSIFFGTAGMPSSAQHLDALRVREMIELATNHGGATRTGFGTLEGMFGRFAEQIGAARAHRLWQGRFLSSNVTVDGALVDFGSFRSVANWRRAMGLPNELFGQESRSLAVALESLCYLFRRFAAAGHAVPEPRNLLATLERRMDSAFLSAALDALGAGTAQDAALYEELRRHIAAYYARQQMDKVLVDDHYDLRRPWLYGMMTARGDTKSDSPEAEALLGVLRRAAGSGRLSLQRARRWFRPRYHMFYNVATAGARICSERLSGEPEADMSIVGRYISRQVSRSRRFSPLMPEDLDICAQVVNGYSSAFYCTDRNSHQRFVWIEGLLHREEVVVFGQRLRLEDIPASITRRHMRAGFALPDTGVGACEARNFTLGARSLCVPAGQYSFG